MKKITIVVFSFILTCNCWTLQFKFKSDTWHNNDLQITREWKNKELDDINTDLINIIIKLIEKSFYESRNKNDWTYSIFFEGWEDSYYILDKYENLFLNSGFIYSEGAVDSEHGNSIVTFFPGKDFFKLLDIFNYPKKKKFMQRLFKIKQECRC